MATSREGSDEGESEVTADGKGPRRSVPPPTVLVADGPNRAQQYREWLQDPFPVRVASAASAAEERISRAVGVAVLGAGVSEDTKQELLEILSARSPFARSVVIPEDDDPPMLEEPGYDSCCFEPVEREELRDVVERLARIATYERAVATYFEYTTHAANLEVGQASEDLESDETYRDIQDRIDGVRETLDRIRASLDEADRRVLMESIEADPTTPELDSDEVVKTDSKRHPDECVDCGLPWGVDHGGTLGSGYEQLGAFVWKCTNCGAVQQAADPSHRRLARR